MLRRDEVAERMADTVLKRLIARKIVDVKDEPSARAAIRHVLLDNLQAEERLEADARQILLEHAKAIKDSAADYRQLFPKVKEKLARDRGFIL
jgi:hypothetical protein